MRATRVQGWLVAALLVLPSCIGGSGPQLPENVGATHSSEGAGGEDAEPEPPAEPVPVGTMVWADYHDTGYHFHGVVVERREDSHRVIYDDGASEWLPAAALLPDRLMEDAEIDVRPTFTDPFLAARLGRRLGRALYVHQVTGDARWTAIPHVRFQRGAVGTPSRGDAAETPPPPEGMIGATVLVNYQGQGLRFAGVVTARGDDGRLHVVYLDGETEWVEPRFVAVDEVGEGDTVHIRRTWDPPQWVRGRVQARVGDALRVVLDDGGVTWTSLFRIRAPLPGSEALDAAPAEVSPDADAAVVE